MNDPAAPGRGPSRMGGIYRWHRVGDMPIIGKFAGYALGTTKAADTLFVELRDGGHIPIRYEHLEAAMPVKRCPSCSRNTLVRIFRSPRWECEHCDG